VTEVTPFDSPAHKVLSEHLARTAILERGGRPEPSGRFTSALDGWTARGILADPQAHIDALVDAGVLEKATSANALGLEDQGRPCYVVVKPKPPHVHDWYIRHDIGPQWWCECGESRIITRPPS
jgi:hypothetical protein